MKLTAVFATLLLIATSVSGESAQSPKKVNVRVGGGEEFDTSRWPKLDLAFAKSNAEIATRVDAFVSDLTGRDLFAGAVLIQRGDAVVFEKAYGLANRDTGTANTTGTKFNIGSINKIFTARAISRLIKAGKLKADDTIATVLPDLQLPEAGKITVQMLLDHRSGLGDIFTDRWKEMPKSNLRTLRDYVPLFADQPLRFAPGADQAYSNAGFVVLGLMIEKLSGESYYDYVRKEIFEPLGMSSTESYELDVPTPGRAAGYLKSDDGIRTNIYTLPARGSSAGGGYSTVGDLARFSADLLKRQPSGGGFGFAGGSPGVNGVIEADAGTGIVIVVLANLSPPSAEYVNQQIRKGMIPKSEE